MKELNFYICTISIDHHQIKHIQANSVSKNLTLSEQPTSCSSVQKLYSLLDSIRVLIGGEQELRWVSALAACRDDEDDMEGSGCISEGSGGLVLEGGEEEGGSGQLPGITTDDEDFVFVDEKEQPRRRGPTPLAKFGKQNLA